MTRSSMTKDKHIVEDRRLDEWEDATFYRQAPDSTMLHETSALFRWPWDSTYQPEDVLGPGCQLLDPIRRVYRCHIALVRLGGCTVLQIFGRDAAVKQVLDRLGKVIFAIEAQRSDPVQQCIVLWPAAQITATHVDLMQARGQPAALMFIASSGHSQSVDEEYQHKVRALQTGLTQALHKARRYNGRLDLCLRLGPLVLDTYRKTPQMTIDDFVSMTKDESFQAHVHHDLRCATRQDILSNLERAEHLFEMPSLSATSLQDTRPTFTTLVTLTDESGNGDIELTRVFQQIGSGLTREYDVVRTNWQRVDSPRFLDFQVIDVSSGLAWAFELDGAKCIPYTRLKKNIQDYVSYYFQIKPDTDPLTSNRPWVPFKGLGRIKRLRQEVTWSFQVRNSDYQLQYTEMQEFDYTQAGTGAFKTGPGPKQTSISLTNTDWEVAFANNQSLGIGEEAAWGGDEMRKRFPITEDAMTSLVELLHHIQRLVLVG